MSTQHTDTSYTRHVKELVALFHDQKRYANTVISDAKSYFVEQASSGRKRQALLDDYKNAKSDAQKSVIQDKLKMLDRDMESSRIERIERLNYFVSRLLALTEGDTEIDTHNASAKFLGTLLLITEGAKGGFAQQHQLLKPIYKAALSLRLTDGLLAKGNIKHSYLGKYIDSHSRFKGNRHWQDRWQRELAYPIVKAALLQDIGLYHPAATTVLYGENDDKDPFRLLSESERKLLLKLNLQNSLGYLKRGLGIPSMAANIHQEKQQQTFIEQQALDFAAEAIQDATILKNHVGDVIKIPQIYASFVLSTKAEYSKKDLPKGYIVIEQLMKNGTLESRIARCFLAMVGYFPQGFGIAYIGEDEQGQQKDGYEFAIVNRLYPNNPAEPTARAVTRNLTYTSAGKDIVVKRGRNLFFQGNHKKIQRVDTARLNEIMSQLSGGQNKEGAEQLIPQFWEPFDFFADKKNQGLWTLHQ